MYLNLNAEMARSKKTYADIVDILKISPSTLSEKMTGKKDFKLGECKKIVKYLFPDLTIDYLFEVSEDK